MSKDISNTDDVIDSRDVIERIEELESLRDDWQSDNELPDYIDDPLDRDIKEWTDEQVEKWEEWDESSEGEELKALKALQDDAEGYSGDWRYGSTLIRDSYFTDYCKELVVDIGDLPKDLPWWIESNINWDGVADDLKVDYTSVDFDGVEYWIR